MFQKRANELFGGNIFTFEEDVKLNGKFSNANKRNENRFDMYLNDLNTTGTITDIMKSIAYNSFDEMMIWKQKKDYLYMYRNNEQVIDDELAMKIYGCVDEHPFIDCMNQYIADYHILFDKNGDVIPLQDMSPIHKAAICFECFPVMYMNTDINDYELIVMTEMIGGVSIMIDLPDKLKLLKFEDGGVDIWEYERTPEELVKMILCIVCNDEVSDEIVNELVGILNVEDE